LHASLPARLFDLATNCRIGEMSHLSVSALVAPRSIAARLYSTLRESCPDSIGARRAI